jgi:hypothetical protein
MTVVVAVIVIQPSAEGDPTPFVFHDGLVGVAMPMTVAMAVT